ncbi:MAG: PfkB family carbohydrate kinase, partial [Armatimonadota bacterium]
VFLPAYQIIDRRLSPGAAGSVVNNLTTLGVGYVPCIGVIGDDGEGYELRRALNKIHANTEHLIQFDECFTPCYTKPMLMTAGIEKEIERLDIKNRKHLPEEAEAELILMLETVINEVDGVIISDQVQERNCGVVTDKVRNAIAEIAEEHSDKPFLVDSRVRIGEFRNVMAKPNIYETLDAVSGDTRPDKKTISADEINIKHACDCGRQLAKIIGKPVFMTAQQNGIFIFGNSEIRVQGFPVDGEIDPVGAGDSCAAGIVSSLCAGANLEEAAIIGNLVASITVQKIGQTGNASPEELLARYDECFK